MKARLAYAAVTAAYVAVTTVVGSAPAGAAAAGRPPGDGWQSFHSQPFSRAAGEVCPFAFTGEIIRDVEWMRTLSSYPDGSPRVQEFTGPLVVRFVNTETGASAVRDLSGTGWLHYQPDGTRTWYLDGNASIGFFAGNPYFPPGEYAVSGRFVVVIHPDNTRELPVHHGRIENLCRTLG